MFDSKEGVLYKADNEQGAFIDDDGDWVNDGDEVGNGTDPNDNDSGV